MTAINVTITGNLTDAPELRFTASGAPVATFNVAVNERFKGKSGEWEDGPTSYVRCNAWRDLAEHAAESLDKGARVIVTGTMRERTYQAKDGTDRRIWEVQASDIGAALRYATVTIKKTRRDSVPVPEDPWARADDPGPAGPPADTDEPPF